LSEGTLAKAAGRADEWLAAPAEQEGRRSLRSGRAGVCRYGNGRPWNNV